MMRRPSHRRIKKRKRSNEKTKMKFTTVLAIMLLAIAMGYLTARYVIGPILGYDADESPIKVSTESEQSQESEKNDTDDNTRQGYALQFGVFSTREAAQKLVDSLAQKGVEATIQESGEQYKVISPIIKTKDQALEKLDEIKDKEVEDVFIASF